MPAFNLHPRSGEEDSLEDLQVALENADISVFTQTQVEQIYEAAVPGNGPDALRRLDHQVRVMIRNKKLDIEQAMSLVQQALDKACEKEQPDKRRTRSAGNISAKLQELLQQLEALCVDLEAPYNTIDQLEAARDNVMAICKGFRKELHAVSIAAQMEQVEVDNFRDAISRLKIKALNMVADQLVHVKRAKAQEEIPELMCAGTELKAEATRSGNLSPEDSKRLQASLNIFFENVDKLAELTDPGETSSLSSRT